MLADRPFESVRAFKSIRPSNLHLPLIVRLRTYNRNPPIPRSICKHVLDSCNHFPLQSRITRILHLHRKGHDIALLSILLAVEQTTARAHPDRACGNTARPKKHSVAGADQILVPSDVSRPHPHPPTPLRDRVTFFQIENRRFWILRTQGREPCSFSAVSQLHTEHIPIEL